MSESKEGARRETKPPEGAPPDAAADALVRGMSEVIAAALGVGASVARATAEATAGSRGVESPPGDRPLEAIVHYGMATVSNVLGLVGSAAGLGVRGAAAAAGAASDMARSAAGVATGGPGSASAASASTNHGVGLPRVRAGHTLRVPLSIENPGAERMSGVTPSCTSLGGGTGVGRRLDASAVRFQPSTLEIAPRDFEKLTVFVDAPADAAPGRYDAVIALGGGGGETRLAFEVTDAA